MSLLSCTDHYKMWHMGLKRTLGYSQRDFLSISYLCTCLADLLIKNLPCQNPRNEQERYEAALERNTVACWTSALWNCESTHLEELWILDYLRGFLCYCFISAKKCCRYCTPIRSIAHTLSKQSPFLSLLSISKIITSLCVKSSGKCLT